MMLNFVFGLGIADVSAVTEAGRHFPVAFVAVLVLGFISAVSIGSVAWYNSKRPPGWENKERPNIVPKIDQQENPGVGTPES